MAETTCLAGDYSVPTRDTLYVIGVELSRADGPPAACVRRALATQGPPVVVAETPAPGTDLRDVLDRGLPAAGDPRPDVVATRDPDVLAYAAAGAGYLIGTLPWDRTYVLVAADVADTIPSDAERDAMARDAVRADVRGAARPFAWLLDSTCVAGPAPLASGTVRPIVAYATGDAIARQLAERIVALAESDPRPAWLPAALGRDARASRVAPVASDSIVDMLASGRAVAAVVAVQRDPRTQCGITRAALPWRGVPLVDSRAHAIIRRGSGATFAVEVDGALRFVRRRQP